jgi:hypothetical protein
VQEKAAMEKWLEDFSRRIRVLANKKDVMRVMEGDQIIFEFDPGELIKVKGNIAEIELGSLGLKIRNGLIGMGGCYYLPDIFWGGSTDHVFEAWEWFIMNMKVDKERFEKAIETESIIEFLVRGREQGLLQYLLSLAVDMFDLSSLGVDISSKISELGSQVRGHLRKFEKLGNKARSFFIIGSLRSYMADLSSECRLARVARKYGYSVILEKHPDLMINNVKVEVKRARFRYLDVKDEKRRSSVNLSNPIKSGMRQDADIIAIDCLDLEKRNIKGIKAVWLGRGKLKEILKAALTIGMNRKCVLLFCATNKGFFGRVILANCRHS